MTTEELNTPIAKLPRTSALTIKRLESIGIKTYKNLLGYYPFRYDNYSKICLITQLIFNEVSTIVGRVEKITIAYTKKNIVTITLKITDNSGSINITFFNQKFITSLLKEGSIVSVAGRLNFFGRNTVFEVLDYEVLSDLNSDKIHTGQIVPVYSSVYGLSTKTIREKIRYILNLYNSISDRDTEFLPESIIKTHNFIGLKKATANIHFPESDPLLEKSKERLQFDELFLRVLSSFEIRKKWRTEVTTKPLLLDEKNNFKLSSLITSLPFKLTKAQERTWSEILADLKKNSPMNRFVQGDVGSGKTVIAGLASYVSYLNNAQTLIMAPTAILAQQHYKTLSTLLLPLGIKIALQTGAKKDITKKNTSAQYDLIVGTHALITESLSYENVGLVVIDEQHRFGVKQRGILKKKGINPHLLTMTATPIPRTVSLTLYSELDLSVIDELPIGRKPIKTYVVNSEKRTKCYQWIKKEILENNAQVYIICPLVEESETESMATVKAATKEFEFLKNTVFRENKIAMLHGKMKAKEKTQIMDDYKAKKYNILVTTSVVEVGVDVPDATIMIIEGAERFGLAQLHQLRGRVGRSDKQSYCFLFPANKGAEFSKRLKFFASTTSGMKLAEYDLKERGPGDVYGTKQSGYSDLVLADISNISLVHKAKNAVDEFTKNFTINNFPALKKAVEELQVEQIAKD